MMRLMCQTYLKAFETPHFVEFYFLLHPNLMRCPHHVAILMYNSGHATAPDLRQRQRMVSDIQNTRTESDHGRS